jgi:hypothetical protein
MTCKISNLLPDIWTTENTALEVATEKLLHSFSKSLITELDEYYYGLTIEYRDNIAL